MRRSVRILVALMVLFLAAAGAMSQTALTGRVTAVADGKTFFMETPNGRIAAAIRYIDVPEPEQPFSRIVREHLERLVMGKTVTFVSNGFSPTALVGGAYVNGIDLGLQLVRDGAAWHVPAARTGQDPDEAAVYDGIEALARTEKRGIWSIRDLTPAWEFRQLKDRSSRGAGFLRASVQSAQAEERNYRPARTDTDMWAEVGGNAFAQRNQAGPNSWGYDPETGIRNTSTPGVAQVLANGRNALEVELRVIYFQGEIKPRTVNTAFILGLLSTSRDGAFAEGTSLTFVADDKEISVGSGQLFWRRGPRAVEQMIQYRISRSDLVRIASAKKLIVKVGKYSGTVGPVLRETLSSLFDAIG